MSIKGDELHRILYISKGGQISGAQRQLLYLLAGLDKTKYAPIVVSTSKGDFTAEMERLGIEYHIYEFNHWRKFKNILRRYNDVKYLCDVAMRNNVSIVHCSDMWLNKQVVLACKKLCIPKVLHVRAPLDRRQIRHFACADADVLIPVSTRIAKRLAATGSVAVDKIIKVNDAVDLKEFDSSKRLSNVFSKEFDIKGKTVIGIVGRVEPNKKQFEFIEIAKEVKINRKVIFFIIGEIKNQLYYNRLLDFMRQNELDGDVHFVGRRKDMPEVLAGLDILVSLSGGSIRYEAMACGCCVVCAWSRQKNESYHIQDEKTGFIISDKEIEPVVGILKKLSADKAMVEQIGKNASDWAQKELGVEKLIEDTQNIYADILERFKR